MSETRKLTPWQKIVRAAKRDSGLRLTADEVFLLSMDDAIETRAARDDLNNAGIPENDHPFPYGPASSL